MDIFGVVSKVTVWRPFAATRETGGMFERSVSSSGASSVALKGALSAGSSKEGIMRRALVGSKCVKAYFSSLPSCVPFD